jgi:lysophospholipase L1-like esterase
MDFSALASKQGKLMVSVGDSFTEGMCDDTLPDGSFRGWADRVAERLAEDDPGLRYANLAVRGKLIGQIAHDQVPAAAAMEADIVTLAGGLNDVLRPRCDIARVERVLTECVETLAADPARTVVLFRAIDPERRMRGAHRIMANVARLIGRIDELAEKYPNVVVIDLFTTDVFDDARMWGEDRLHLSNEGHLRVAEAVMQALGAEPRFDWRTGLPPARPTPWLVAQKRNAHWVWAYLLPWIGRRLRGRSSGDGRPPKRPVPAVVTAAMAVEEG